MDWDFRLRIYAVQLGQLVQLVQLEALGQLAIPGLRELQVLQVQLAQPDAGRLNRRLDQLQGASRDADS